MLNRFLFKQIDNTSLIIFRIIFGLLIFLESVGAIFTGWVKRAFMIPEMNFSFIGFEWLQPLPGYGMYYYYVLMGVFGLFVMLGFKYKWSLGGFTLMWTATYLMQKTSYNNHYYLLILLCLVMLVMPANKYLSVDAKINPKIKAIAMPNWCRWLIILQMWIVYTYASVAKWYPDWFNLSVIEVMMHAKANYPIVGALLQYKWMHGFLAYSGILYDLLVIPLLLYKPTRKWAFFASIFFHLFNSFVFQVGIFPYLSLAFSLFFFEPEIIRKYFLKRKPLYTAEEIIIPPYHQMVKWAGAVYLAYNILMPLRHWVIPGNVLWTEEGHRMSWRMMLRTKTGHVTIRVTDKKTNETWVVKKSDYLTPKQSRLVATKPDFAWQFAQVLKKEYAKEGKDVSIHMVGTAVVNKSNRNPLINPEVDMASASWNTFSHNDWIMPFEKE
ncbi:HTTM domain-containing protein [Neptunitalea lumnitzerae]|uniref:Type I deoxyribonuclease HsdR n=1 Tax=Neptunitalea lumnitzerae TaxID=2965509 RepID=A0ABQ5MG47_9FLAO|nr:HTTM domain-containing protein [Neptunitalea sp. Y10]GLB48394.1 type I deoxyribonuclease HsdR [Neptunitalea sp. Y10]